MRELWDWHGLLVLPNHSKHKRYSRRMEEAEEWMEVFKKEVVGYIAVDKEEIYI